MDTKKLRQKILDLAIRGKLVPQDPNDEPASVLLERIRAEKERLIKEGKIKRGKKSASDTPHYENEAPFEVPKSWEWVRLDSIGDIVTGSTPPKDNKELYGGHIPFYKPTDLEQGINTTTSTDSLTEEGFAVARQLPTDSILVTCIGATIGKTGMIRKAGTCNQQINAIVSFPGIFPDYIYYVCISDFMQSNIKDNASATTLPILNKNHFAELRIPLPPIEEQKRIVAAIEKWFSLIDTLESAKEDLRTSIEHTKSKILDLAIHGKLVPQDPNDEPAIEFLKRINPKFTPCDNAHYENVPSNWVVCTVKDVFRINPKTKADDGIDAGFVPMSNIQDSFKNSFSFETKNWGNIKKGYTHFENDDIVVAKISPCLENRKSAVMVGLPNGIGAGTTELNVFRSDSIHPLYGLFFFKSDYFISQCVGTFNGVVGQQRVSTKIIEDIAFPVPPRSEQERIIKKVSKLFQILDCISAEL